MPGFAYLETIAFDLMVVFIVAVLIPASGE